MQGSTSAEHTPPPIRCLAFHFIICTLFIGRISELSSRLNLSEENMSPAVRQGNLLLVFLPGARQDFTAVLPQLSSAYGREKGHYYYYYCVMLSDIHLTANA